MHKLGLIGKQLGHSFSKKYFEEKFARENIDDYEYELYPLTEIGELSDLLKNEPHLVGLNVTIPYKEDVIPFLHELDETASATGAVNCIKIENKEGHQQLKGYNTDTFGFRQSIKPFLEPQHDKALIIGTGGASKAVEYVLKEIGVECFFVSRVNKENAPNVFSYEQLSDEMIGHFKLIVNTSPVGMYPEIGQCPKIPLNSIAPGYLVYDLIYNPAETILLREAKERGAVAINGLSMLYHQADKAWEIWQEKEN